MKLKLLILLFLLAGTAAADAVYDTTESSNDFAGLRTNDGYSRGSVLYDVGYHSDAEGNFGLHFDSVGIPAGATIDSAFVTFSAWENDDSVHLAWACEDTASATQWTTTEADWNSKIANKTTATVAWNLDENVWTSEERITGPDIADCIQEWVDISGHDTTSSLNIFIYTTGSFEGRKGIVTQAAGGGFVGSLVVYFTEGESTLTRAVHSPDGAAVTQSIDGKSEVQGP